MALRADRKCSSKPEEVEQCRPPRMRVARAPNIPEVGNDTRKAGTQRRRRSTFISSQMFVVFTAAINSNKIIIRGLTVHCGGSSLRNLGGGHRPR